MEFELWYLVAVPLLFGAGWWLRGLDTRQRGKFLRGVDDNCFKGLSLLLSDEPDKAIDHFIEVVRIDPETIELHHALGNLFRRRGEFDRAIRLHTFLANRSELPAKERSLAVSELAQDFLKAGIFDRAESCCMMLLDTKDRRREGLNRLVKLYCTEHEWEKAAEKAGALEREFGEDRHVEISHFLCEQAEAARSAGDRDRAAEFTAKALSADPESVRAHALAADIALAAGKGEEALEAWGFIEAEKPEYIPLIAEKKAALMAEKDRGAALAYLKEEFERTGSAGLLTAVVKRLAEWKSLDEAGEYTLVVLKQRPLFSTFAALCDIRLRQNPDDEQTKVLAGIISRQAKKAGRYQCRRCGFLAHTFQWQCPGCEDWNSFPPQRSEERA